MLEEFIKLTAAEGDQSIYTRPDAIVVMCYDHENDRTKITTLHGANIHQAVVEETPGVICDKCNNSVTSGVGFFTLLGVAFIVMKLCGVINWSWLWVLAPLWMPLALLGIVINVVLAIMVIKGK